MPPVGFEPTISAGERPQTYALERAATGTGIYIKDWLKPIAPVFCNLAPSSIKCSNTHGRFCPLPVPLPATGISQVTPVFVELNILTHYICNEEQLLQTLKKSVIVHVHSEGCKSQAYAIIYLTFVWVGG